MDWSALWDDLGELWGQIISVQPDPPDMLVLGTGLAALFVVLTPAIWRLARNAITIAHEGGHALIALLTGRRLRSIRLHSDTSGLTVSAGKPTGFGMVLTLFFGYPAPSLLGLAAAAGLGAGRITMLLWITVLLLAAMLLMIRNLYGMLAVIVTGGAVFAVAQWTSPTVQAAFAYLAVWFLLIGGVKPVGELQSLRRRGRLRNSDADQLAGLTSVPPLFWIVLFGLISMASLVLGATLLTGVELPG